MTTTRRRVKVRKVKALSPLPQWRVIRTPEGGFTGISGLIDALAAAITAPTFTTHAEAIEYAHHITRKEQE